MDTKMHGSRSDLPVSVEADGIQIRQATWGNTRVSFETDSKRMDVTPLLKGLPDNLDQAHHWGYVFKGQFRVIYKDGREEVVKAGEAYHVEPGHTVISEAGTEILEFSLESEIKKTEEVIMRNFELMSKTVSSRQAA
jgi:hypothetical protein